MRKGWNCIGMKKRAMAPRFTVLNRKIRNKKGYTLAEVTVTLALTVVLAGAAFFFLERGLALYGRIQAAADAVSVSDMVLSRISGEIKRAGTDSEAEIGGGENGCQHLVLSGPARTVRIEASADREGLLIGWPPQEQKRWSFDSVISGGCRIWNLSFSVLEKEEGKRIIQICLVIRHPETGFSFRRVRNVELGQN